MNPGEDNVYTRLGARPVINGGGNTTVWSGSTPPPVVMQAMMEAANSYIEMEELLETSGARIADLVGTEAAYATAGCYAALVLSTAACITGNDPERAAQLPDMTGFKSEIVFQHRQQYTYDRAYTIPGSKLVLAGDDAATTSDQLSSAIGPDTVAVAFLISNDKDDSIVSLEDTVDIAHAKGVPVIADAAAQIYPLDYLRKNAQSADLVCFGGKYLGAPHSMGFVCGKKDLIEAVTAHGFIGTRSFGRGMKADRQGIIGLVTALEEWISVDHEERMVQYGAKFSAIEQAVQRVSGVKETKVVPISTFYGLVLHVVLDTDKLGKSADDVYNELLQGTPRIRLATVGDDTLTVNAHTLLDGEEQVVGERLRDILDV